MKLILLLKQNLIGRKISFYINFDPNHLKTDTIKSFTKMGAFCDIETQEGYLLTISIYEDLHEYEGSLYIQTFATKIKK